MGCNKCRISQMDTDFFKTCKTSKIFIPDFEPLLTISQRNFWIKQLDIIGIPESDFWSDDNKFHHNCFTQIAKDINRTFPTLSFFSNKAHINRFQLLLKKFAIYFPKVGYTQGLNFIAGYLLMCGFDDDMAFKILVSLMIHDKIMAIGLYEDQFLMNKFYCEVFWNLLEVKLPKVAAKIRKAKVQDEIWIFQWFISMFLYSFPTEHVKKFWDFIILKKQLSIVLIALGIVRCLKNDILSLNDPDEFSFLQLFENTKQLQFCKHKLDSKKLIAFINSFTTQQIDHAAQEAKCVNNQYKKYFTSGLTERNQMYIKQMKLLRYERASFMANPDPKRYKRAQGTTNQLQNLMLSKFKLYQSDCKRSNSTRSIFKMSTFSISVDDLRNNEIYGVNSYPKTFGNPILSKINFTQSKIIETDSKFQLSKKSKLFTSPIKITNSNFSQIISRQNSDFETSGKNIEVLTPSTTNPFHKKQKLSKQSGNFLKKSKFHYNK